MSTRIREEAVTLVERLRKLQAQRFDSLAAGRKRQAHDAVALMCDLLDDAGRTLHREALLAATEPQQPIPVVLGPHDTAVPVEAIVGVDEVMALANVHLQAVLAVVRGQALPEHADRALGQLRDAVETLALAAVGADGGRTVAGGAA